MIFKTCAKLAQVYGWTDNQILQLTIKKFWAYSSEANVITTEQQLKAFEASVYPHLNKNGRKQLWESCLQLLKKPKSEKQKRVEKRRFFKLLKARGLDRG